MSRYHPYGDPRMRLSDAEREEAIAQLSEHYAAGRLDKDEFDERSDAVWTAKTGADLAPIFADLGPVRDPRREAPRPWARRGFPVPFVPVIVLLVVLTVLTHVPFILLAFFGCLFVFTRRGHWRW